MSHLEEKASGKSMSAFRVLSRDWTAALIFSSVLWQPQYPKSVLLNISCINRWKASWVSKAFPQGQPKVRDQLWCNCLLLIARFPNSTSIHTCYCTLGRQVQLLFVVAACPFSLIQGLITVLCDLYLQHSFCSCLSCCLLERFLSFVMKNNFTACSSPSELSQFPLWASGSSPLVASIPYPHLSLRQARPPQVSSGTGMHLSLASLFLPQWHIPLIFFPDFRITPSTKL